MFEIEWWCRTLHANMQRGLVTIGFEKVLPIDPSRPAILSNRNLEESPRFLKTTDLELLFFNRRQLWLQTRFRGRGERR